MPVISRFYGISIMMFFKDHNPPYFHAKHEGQIAIFDIRSHRVLAGGLPPQATRLVREWLKQDQKELHENWKRAQTDKQLKAIEPLA